MKKTFLGWLGGLIFGCILSVLITITFHLTAGLALIIGVGCGMVCSFAGVLIAWRF